MQVRVAILSLPVGSLLFSFSVSVSFLFFVLLVCWFDSHTRCSQSVSQSLKSLKVVGAFVSFFGHSWMKSCRLPTFLSPSLSLFSFVIGIRVAVVSVASAACCRLFVVTTTRQMPMPMSMPMPMI